MNVSRLVVGLSFASAVTLAAQGPAPLAALARMPIKEVTVFKDGNAFVFFGEIREVREPELIERTFAWEGMPGKQSVERAEFEELDGDRTRIVVVSRFDSKEDRDGMLESGMDRGVNDSYERLDELFARQQA